MAAVGLCGDIRCTYEVFQGLIHAYAHIYSPGGSVTSSRMELRCMDKISLLRTDYD